jgi:hypothetical protein
LSRTSGCDTCRTSPAKPDLTEEHGISGGRDAIQCRHQSRRNSQIGSRFIDTDPSRDIQIHIAARELQAARVFPAPPAPLKAVRCPSRSRRGAVSPVVKQRPAPAPRPIRAASPREQPRARHCLLHPAGVAKGTGQTGLATSTRPSFAISNTPISSVGPKRFLTARRMRNWCATIPLEIQYGINQDVPARGVPRFARPWSHARQTAQ